MFIAGMWSFQPLNFFAFYEAFCKGEELQLKQPRPYRDYIDWLGRLDFGLTENFWRSRLKGFTVPTPLTVDHIHQLKLSEVDGGYGVQDVRLSEAVTSALQSSLPFLALIKSTILKRPASDSFLLYRPNPLKLTATV